MKRLLLAAAFGLLAAAPVTTATAQESGAGADAKTGQTEMTGQDQTMDRTAGESEAVKEDQTAEEGKTAEEGQTAEEGKNAGNTAPEIAEMALGDPDAPVTVVEYASFTCPHCARFHNEVFGRIKKNYIDPGKVRFVYREVYFDRPGLWASMVARCGGKMRFFGIADMLYENQRAWLGDGKPVAIADNLRRIARKAGMEKERIASCMQDADKAQALISWYEANAEKDDIDATPSFIVDGEKKPNMSYEDFAAMLDEKLAAAQ